MVPCVNIWRDAPVSPSGETAPATPATDDSPRSKNPIWLMLLKAISRFKSVCLSVTTAP